MNGRFAGVDVGARELTCAAVDEEGRVLDTAVLRAHDREALRDWCAGAAVVAVDAPQAPSTTPHAGDNSLPPKFRVARCGEIALGRVHGHWVPWVAPPEPPFPAWMEAGFAVYRALAGADAPELIEVYPHAAFVELAAGGRPAPKRTAAGRRERAGLLARAGIKGLADRPPPSHDELDALVSALATLHRSLGTARRAGCGHDGSAIWLPARLA